MNKLIYFISAALISAISLSANAERKVLSITNNTGLFISCSDNGSMFTTQINPHSSKEVRLRQDVNLTCESIFARAESAKDEPDHQNKAKHNTEKKSNNDNDNRRSSNAEKINIVVELDGNGNLVLRQN